MATSTRRSGTSRNSTRSTTSRVTRDVDARQQQQAAQQKSQQRMAHAADTATAMLRGAEVWTQVQLHALQRTGQTWREAADQIRAAQGPLELMAAHNQLAMNTFVQAMQLGQEFLQAALVSQPEIVRTAHPEPAEAPAGDAMTPMMQVWQAMMPAGLNGAAATTH